MSASKNSGPWTNVVEESSFFLFFFLRNCVAGDYTLVHILKTSVNVVVRISQKEMWTN